MSGFLRALRGELYALFHRRSLRFGLVLVVLGVLLQVLGTWAAPAVLPGGEGLAENVDAARANFWPRFAQAAGFGLALAELAALVLVGGALPREIAHCAVRDPLTRGISRPAYAAARGLTAVFCPFVLGAAALLSAGLGCALLYDGGHAVSEPFFATEDAGAQQRFDDWLAERGMNGGDLAAWVHLVEEEGLEGPEASESLGIPVFELPEDDDFYSQIPYLVFLEDEVASGVRQALRQAVPPLVALALFAFLLSILLPTGALASGAATTLVVLFSVFLAPEMADKAGFVFADWLPGMGNDSALRIARRIGDGFTDTVPPSPEALAQGLRWTWIQAAVFFAVATSLFPRKRL